MPSNSIASWAGVSATLPSLAVGQTNQPLSSRFVSCHCRAIGASGNGDAGALALPPDDLHQIAAATAEDEEVAGERVLLQHGLGHRGQRREARAHVGRPGRQPDLRVHRNRDHPDSPRISRASAWGS